jgi:hypothetical protein
MSRSRFDPVIGPVLLAGVLLCGAVPGAALAQAPTTPPPPPAPGVAPRLLTPILSSEVQVSRDEAVLELELEDGGEVTIELRDGRAYVDGDEVGAVARGSALDRSWRDLLDTAMDMPTEQLAVLLFNWEPPADGVGSRLDRALESALARGEDGLAAAIEDAEAQVEAAMAGHDDSLALLRERLAEMEERLAERDAMIERTRPARRVVDWFAPFRHIWGGLMGVISLLVTYAVLLGMGVAIVFFDGRRYLEAVADTARQSTVRSFLVGLAGSFLLLPAWILGIVALAISILGIPLLLVWVPLFPVAVTLAVLLGYLAVSHAAGEALAERRFYGSDWFQKANSYYYLATGLGLLLVLFVAANVVQMAGPWLGFLDGLLSFFGIILTWAAATIGFGAVLLTRAGTRPVTSGLAREAREADLFEEDSHV